MGRARVVYHSDAPEEEEQGAALVGQHHCEDDDDDNNGVDIVVMGGPCAAAAAACVGPRAAAAASLGIVLFGVVCLAAAFATQQTLLRGRGGPPRGTTEPDGDGSKGAAKFTTPPNFPLQGGGTEQEEPSAPPASEPKTHAKHHKCGKNTKQAKEETKHESLPAETPPPDNDFPSVTDLVHGKEVTGDVSWMLDFAIVGNAKCGTSFLMRYLGLSDGVYLPQHEICKMSKARPDEIVKVFYNQSMADGKKVVPPGGSSDDDDDDGRTTTRRYGIKCPKSLSTELALPNYGKYFPDTKFIVTTRHPVLWFQSFYNYRSHGNGKLPPPHKLVGACVDGSPYVCSKKCAFATRTQNVCTDRSKFHHYLSRFGKTSMSTPEEMQLLNHTMSIVPVGGKVFLMELGQVFPSNEGSRHLGRDLQRFLGLRNALPELEDLPPESDKYTDEERKFFINICDEEHAEVRSILVDIGREASVWIRDYFLKSSDVVVSSRAHFVAMIEKWGHDPCL